MSQFTWMNDHQFYTLTTVTDQLDEMILARIGANDPSFNLRNDPTIILRKKDIQNTTFVSVLETHGNYNFVTERAKNTYSTIDKVAITYQDDNYIAVTIIDKYGVEVLMIVNLNNKDTKQNHEITIQNKVYKWTGNYLLIK